MSNTCKKINKSNKVLLDGLQMHDQIHFGLKHGDTPKNKQTARQKRGENDGLNPSLYLPLSSTYTHFILPYQLPRITREVVYLNPVT